MKQVYVSILFFLNFFVSAQNRIDTLRFFYNINSTEPIERNQVISLKNSDNIDQIQITGYADFLHSSVYNIALSQKRATHIRELLLKHFPGLRDKITSCIGKGEEFSKGDSATGEQFWRRVDVIISRNSKPADSQPKSVTAKPRAVEPVVEQPDKPLEDLKKGETITLEGLSFIPGRHMILPSSGPKLEELLQKLEENPGLKIEIQGHVCCTENGRDGLDLDTKKYELSVNRAKAVFDYLLKNGINKSRLRYRGFGGSRHKVIEDSPENEQVNRRVEIMITDSGEKEEE